MMVVNGPLFANQYSMEAKKRITVTIAIATSTMLVTNLCPRADELSDNVGSHSDSPSSETTDDVSSESTGRDIAGTTDVGSTGAEDKDDASPKPANPPTKHQIILDYKTYKKSKHYNLLSDEVPESVQANPLPSGMKRTEFVQNYLGEPEYYGPYSEDLRNYLKDPMQFSAGLAAHVLVMDGKPYEYAGVNACVHNGKKDPPLKPGTVKLIDAEFEICGEVGTGITDPKVDAVRPDVLSGTTGDTDSYITSDVSIKLHYPSVLQLTKDCQARLGPNVEFRYFDMPMTYADGLPERSEQTHLTTMAGTGKFGLKCSNGKRTLVLFGSLGASAGIAATGAGAAGPSASLGAIYSRKFAKGTLTLEAEVSAILDDRDSVCVSNSQFPFMPRVPLSVPSFGKAHSRCTVLTQTGWDTPAAASAAATYTLKKAPVSFTLAGQGFGWQCLPETPCGPETYTGTLSINVNK